MNLVLFAVTLKSEFCFPSLKSSVVGEDWVERGRNLFIIATPLKRWRIEESGRGEGNNNSNSNRKEPEDGAGNYKTATAAAARESLCNRDGVYGGGIGVEEEDDQRQVWCQEDGQAD